MRFDTAGCGNTGHGVVWCLTIMLKGEVRSIRYGDLCCDRMRFGGVCFGKVWFYA